MMIIFLNLKFLNKTWRVGKNKELHDLINQWLKEKNCPVNLGDLIYIQTVN